MKECKTIGCHKNIPITDIAEFCVDCSLSRTYLGLPRTELLGLPKNSPSTPPQYHKYFKDVSALLEIDVYAVHELFHIEDCSGAIQHASKKLLLSGVRTGGKSKYQDIKEARDTLNRWLEINANQSEE